MVMQIPAGSHPGRSASIHNKDRSQPTAAALLRSLLRSLVRTRTHMHCLAVLVSLSVLPFCGQIWAQTRPANKSPATAETNSPASGTAAVAPGSNDAMAKTLCSVLKRANAKGLAADPPALQLELIMSTGKALEYDAQRMAVAKSDIDKLTSASCPIERELMLSAIKQKSLAQAIR